MSTVETPQEAPEPEQPPTAPEPEDPAPDESEQGDE